MSGLFEKRADGASRRDARSQKEHLARRKTRIIAVSVVSVIAVLFACAMFVNSNFIRRTLPAITIGGVKFSAAEFDYFYNTAFHEYAEMIDQQFQDLPGFAESMLPDRSKSHANQIYDPESGLTWADFFTNRAIQSMSSLVQFYNAAAAANFVLSPETLEAIDNQLAELIMISEWYYSMYPMNYPGADSYIQAMYGSSINEKTLRKILNFIYTAASYGEQMNESIVYSDSQIAAYYLENRDDLDVFRYRAFLVRPDTPDYEVFNSDEEYDAAAEVALAEAVELAEHFALMIATEEDFIHTARDYDDLSYEHEASTLREQMGEELDSVFAAWLMDEGRLYGDVATIDIAAGSYVTFFIERDDNNYQMASMRQILIMREQIDPEDYMYGEDDPDYLVAFEMADIAVADLAQGIYDSFVFGGASEARLLELIEEGKSHDDTEGGFYSDMARHFYEFYSQSGYVMRVVPEIEQWLFAPGRLYGDSALVRTEAYGYHLLYFMGYGDTLRDVIALDRMRVNGFNEWVERLPEVEAVKNWAFIFVQA